MMVFYWESVEEEFYKKALAKNKHKTPKKGKSRRKNIQKSENKGHTLG